VRRAFFMTQFVALYSGPDLGAAELVAISTSPTLCADVATQMLREEAETVAGAGAVRVSRTAPVEGCRDE
jgi:hypothetical protein